MKMFLNKQMFNFLHALMEDIIDCDGTYLEFKCSDQVVADAQGILAVLNLVKCGDDDAK